MAVSTPVRCGDWLDLRTGRTPAPEAIGATRCGFWVVAAVSSSCRAEARSPSRYTSCGSRASGSAPACSRSSSPSTRSARCSRWCSSRRSPISSVGPPSARRGDRVRRSERRRVPAREHHRRPTKLVFWIDLVALAPTLAALVVVPETVRRPDNGQRRPRASTFPQTRASNSPVQGDSTFACGGTRGVADASGGRTDRSSVGAASLLPRPPCDAVTRLDVAAADGHDHAPSGPTILTACRLAEVTRSGLRPTGWRPCGPSGRRG